MKQKSNWLNSFILGVLSFVLLWWLLAVLLKNRAIPAPWETFQTLWSLKDQVLLHTLASLGRMMLALFFAFVVGVPCGIALSLSPRLNRVLSPLLYFLYPLPKVAFLPVFMIFWGLGNLSKIILLFTIIVLQMIVLVRDGVNQIPRNYQRTMTNFHASLGQRIYYLILPAIYPHLLASLRVSIGIALASLFFAENYATTYGLGYLILSAWTKMAYDEMFAGIFCIALLGFALFTLLDALEKRRAE